MPVRQAGQINRGVQFYTNFMNEKDLKESAYLISPCKITKIHNDINEYLLKNDMFS